MMTIESEFVIASNIKYFLISVHPSNHNIKAYSNHIKNVRFDVFGAMSI